MSRKDLDSVYANAKVVNFDQNDKIVLISDVHRGDGTYSDSFVHNRNIYIAALKYYLKNDYVYIEVGDGDELWKNRNYNEIAYFYNDIYEIFNEFKNKIKNGKNEWIHCIYGNHDFIKKKKNFKEKQKKYLKKIDDNHGEEFIKFIDGIEYHEGINLRYTPLQEDILVTHGDQLDFFNYEAWKINMFLVRYIWRFLSGIAGFKDQTESAKSKTKRGHVDRKLENWAKENFKMIICGHTHKTRFPKKDEPPYFNIGCCVYPSYITAIEIENGKIQLVKWKIDVNDDEGSELMKKLCKERSNRFLWVNKEVIDGPSDISQHLLRAKEVRDRARKS